MRTLLAITVIVSLGACTTAEEPPGGAAMPLVNGGGQQIGTVRAWQTTGGVTFRIEAEGLPHEKGGRPAPAAPSLNAWLKLP